MSRFCFNVYGGCSFKRTEGKHLVRLILDNTLGLERKDWEFVALLWASEVSTGIYKYHEYGDLKRRVSDFGWNVPSCPTLPYTSIIETRTYGGTDFLYALSDASCYYRTELEEKMSEELGSGIMTKIRKFAKKWKDDHQQRQREEIRSHVFQRRRP